MSVSVAQLIDQSKLLADKRSDPSIADTDWLVFVNWGVEAWWRFKTGIDPNLYFASSSFTLTGGGSTEANATFDLSTIVSGGVPIFRAMHGLDLNPDLPQRRTIPRRNFRQRNIGAVGWWRPTFFAMDRGYDLRARKLVLTPYESSAGNYRVYFRAKPYTFTSTVDATPLDGELEPEAEAVALIAARKGLGQEESDTSELGARLEAIKEEVISAHQRDDGEPDTIADVEYDGPVWP